MANWICLPFHLNKNTWVDASLLQQFRASPPGTSTLADLWSQGLEFQAIATLCLHALSVARELTMWHGGPVLPSVFSHSAFGAEK